MSRASVALGVIVAFLAGGAAALLVSSADDERGSATTVTTALQATTPAQEQLRVDEREYRLDEADPRVRAGVIAILATNSGTKTHALAVETPHGEIRSEDIEPRESTRLKVDLAPGRYAL